MSEQKDSMPPEFEAANSERKFTKRVAELIEIGLESPDIYAFHGTSVEAIRYLAVHGRLPPLGSCGTEFFYVPDGIGSMEGDAEHAKSYAAWNAQKYFLLEKLPFRPSNMESFMNMFVDDDLEKLFLKEAAEHGVSKKQLYRWMNEAERTRKGVLLTISKKILTDFEEKPGEDFDQKYIVTPNGLPIEYITGIEPLGQHEWVELIKIQEKADQQS